MVSFRDLRAHEETLEAWEQRARRAEADGSAKHWELVAAREAQRRLRMRLHQIEHRPLRVISRVLRGKPAKLGPGPAAAGLGDQARALGLTGASSALAEPAAAPATAGRLRTRRISGSSSR